MSSGFISEAEIAANKAKRQEEWEKVRQPNEPLEVEEAPYDSRSLYDKLKEQKDKKDYEYEEAHKLKNLIRGLDDDEVDFLHVIDTAKAKADHAQQLAESRELREFREQVASIQEQNMDSKLQAQIAKPKVTTKLSSRPSQKSILAGMVRKRPATSQPTTTTTTSAASSTSSTSSDNAVASSSAPSASSKSTPPAQPAKSSAAAAVAVTSTAAASPGAQVGGLRCVGILPGFAAHHDSSESSVSSDTDAEYEEPEIDWLGRKKRRCPDDGGGGAGCDGGAGGGGHQH